VDEQEIEVHCLDEQILQDALEARPVEGDVSAPENKQLVGLVKLAQMQIDLERQIADMTDQLGMLTDDLQRLRTDTLPQAMISAGTTSFTMLDGSEVNIEKMYFASIPSLEAIEKAKSPEEAKALKDRREEAIDWFRVKGHADLIKNVVRANFGKGEDAKARKLAAFLIKLKADFTEQEGVHPTTLRAFIKEQMEKGLLSTEDMQVLGANTLDIAKIKPRKEKKEKQKR
jgi:hypothetical protein